MALKEKYVKLLGDPFAEINKKRIGYSIAAIVVFTFLSFLPSLFNDFTNWDDDQLVLNNPHIRGLSFHYLKEIFSSFHLGHYNPLVILSFALEYKLFAFHPFPYHLNNLILHIINSVLVFLLFFRLTNRIFTSFLGGLIFGVHPLHVESVAWITERKDVLYSVFYLSALIFYLDYMKDKKLKFYFISLGFFILSLLSKGMAITLPLVFILCDYLNDVKFKTENFREKTPFFILSFFFGVIAIIGTIKSGATKSEFAYNFIDNIFIASHGIVFYIFKIFIPCCLSALYPFPQKTGALLPFIFVMSPLFAAALVYGVYYSRKFTKKVIFGSAFFLVVIGPVLQLIPSGPAFAADRYAYLSSIGIIFLVCEGIYFLCFDFFKDIDKIRKGILCAVFLIILVFGVTSHFRCMVWKNSFSLWNDVIKKHPDSATALNNRGSAYLSDKQFSKAEADFAKALEVSPGYFKAYYNIGYMSAMQGDFKDAEKNYKKAIAINPKYIDALNNIGVVYSKRGEFQKALDSFTESIKINPENPESYNNRGLLYVENKQYDAALPDLNRALEIQIYYPQAYYNRGLAYFYKKQYANAVEDFSQALKINPTYKDALFNRSISYQNSGKSELALQDLNSLLEIDPEHSDGLKNKGSILDEMGKYDEAIENLDKAIALNPYFDSAYLERGIVYSHKKLHTKAQEDFRKTIALNPRSADAYNNLAVSYFLEEKYEKAWDVLGDMEQMGFQVNLDFINELKQRSGKIDVTE